MSEYWWEEWLIICLDCENAPHVSLFSAQVLPLILENVVTHTETDKYAVDKDDTVEAFLKTLGEAQGQYLINTAPDIVPIPTPVPQGQSMSIA